MRLRSSFAFLTPVAAVLCAASAVRAQAPAHTPAATSATAAATTPVATQAPAPAQDLDACIGASEQAVAARKAGKLLEARKQLTICSAPACPDAMRASCQQRNADLGLATPRIAFQVTRLDGGDVGDVRLSIDGVVYAEHLSADPITLDPGDHEFRFEVPGVATLTKHFVLYEEEQRRIEKVALGTEPRPAFVPTPAVAPAPTEPAADASGSPASSHSVSLRWLGLGVGATGVVSVIVGAGLGAAALSKWSDAKSQCGTGCLSGSPAYATRSDATTFATISTVTIVAGGILAAGGLTVFLVAPKPGDAPASPSVAFVPGLGGAAVNGAF